MPVKNNVAGYTDYFRRLAVTHHLIKHDPQTEEGGGDIGDKRFYKWDATEVVTALRGQIGYPALLIELYDNQLNSEVAFDIRQRPKGAFTVLATAADETSKAQDDAYELAEEIMYDLLRQIWQDHYGENNDRCATPFKQFHFHNQTITPTGKLFVKEYGFRVLFDFEFQDIINITDPPAAGTFI